MGGLGLTSLGVLGAFAWRHHLCEAGPSLVPRGQLLFVHSFPYLLCAQNVEVYTGTRFIYVFASALITPLTSSSPRPSPSAALGAGPGSRSARGTSGLPRTVCLTPSPGPSCQTRPPGCGAQTLNTSSHAALPTARPLPFAGVWGHRPPSAVAQRLGDATCRFFQNTAGTLGKEGEGSMWSLPEDNEPVSGRTLGPRGQW